MPENDARPAEPDHAESRHPALSFEKTVAHLSAGYENSQAVVRFLDTKAAAVIGGVPVMLGILAAVFNWAYDAGLGEIGAGSPIHRCITVAVAVAAALGILCLAWCAINAAFKALIPRDTGTAEASVVFPFKSADFSARLALFLTHATESHVIEDYTRQIDRMSEIVATKLRCVARSIRFVRYLLAAALTSVAVMVIAVAAGGGSVPKGDCSSGGAVHPNPAPGLPVELSGTTVICSYTHDFSDPPSDWADGACAVEWCDTPNMSPRNGCDTPVGALSAAVGADGAVVLRCRVAGTDATSMRIAFRYSQFSEVKDLAPFWLGFKQADNKLDDCPSDIADLEHLNKTWAPGELPTCYDGGITVPLDEDTEEVYWRWIRHESAVGQQGALVDNLIIEWLREK